MHGPTIDFATMTQDYGVAIEAGRYTDARDVVQAALAAGATGAEVFTRVLTPAMYRIGERWERGEINAADEHLATAISSAAATAATDLLFVAPDAESVVHVVAAAVSARTRCRA